MNPTPTKDLTVLSNFRNLASDVPVGGSHKNTYISVRQVLATLSTPAVQHMATTGRAHTSAKTMFVFALAIVWLKCAFHQNTSYL